MNQCYCNYSDKDMTTDVLSSQKHLTDGYNSYANEVSSLSVKSALMDILDEEHQIGHSVFELMNKRGWYPTENAPQDKIAQAKQKFSSYSCCCQ